MFLKLNLHSFIIKKCIGKIYFNLQIINKKINIRTYNTNENYKNENNINKYYINENDTNENETNENNINKNYINENDTNENETNENDINKNYINENYINKNYINKNYINKNYINENDTNENDTNEMLHILKKDIKNIENIQIVQNIENEDIEETIDEKYKFIYEYPKHIETINDDPIIRRPGSIINIKNLLRNNWTFPPVGFNSILQLPIYKFESEQNHYIKYINIPSDIFGIIIRSDILHKCYYYYRTILAGYTERMQLYKWEFPGSTKKYRSQKKSGKARMNWRKTSGRYLGVKNHPIRPHDQKSNINKKILWKGIKIMLSAKFAQDQIKIVDSFLLKSHKTKYTIKYLRNILGKNCNSALLIHEGKSDVNDNFLWATANITNVKRENVEGVNIYNLLKYRYAVFTYKALKNLIYNIKIYPFKNKWVPCYATPNNKIAPKPEKVKNWNILWTEKKKRNNYKLFNKEDLKNRIKEWKWSNELKGPLKIKKNDPYKNFILKKFKFEENIPENIKYEYLFNVDDSDEIDLVDHLIMIDEMLNDEYLLNANSLSTLNIHEKNNKIINNNNEKDNNENDNIDNNENDDIDSDEDDKINNDENDKIDNVEDEIDNNEDEIDNNEDEIDNDENDKIR